VSNPAKLLLAGPIARATVPSPVDWRHWLKLSLAKTLGVLSFTPLTMLQACAQAVDFKVGHHFGEGQVQVYQAHHQVTYVSGRSHGPANK
jgi:hypothetical protein